MTIIELLRQLDEKNITLSMAGAELVVRGQKQALDSWTLTQLRENKQALLELIRTGRYASSASFRGTSPLVELTEEEVERVVSRVEGGAANLQDIYPLMPLQEGMLFHYLMGGQGDPYLLVFEASFDSRVRLDAYLEAMQAVIDRHDILRTAVQWEGLREPVQVVWRKAVLPVEEVEMDGEAGDIARQLYERFNPRRYRLDLRQAPLVRVYITEDKENERWVMLQLRHHVTGDHSTLELMQEEIEAHLVGEEDRLPEPMPFRNLVAQARLGVSREEHEEYFRKVLGDVEEPTAPFGMLEVRGDGTGIEERRMRVEGELGRRLREEARKRGVSAASVCHVAWGQVLARIAGRDDVVFGTVLLGRMQGGEGADRVMGLFINTLPVRIEIGSDGAETSVRRMHAQLSELLGHEHASLALAQRCSAVAAPTPLFSALLNYRHSPGIKEHAEQRNPLWNGTQLVYVEERTNYPVTLSVDDFGEGFGLTAQAVVAIGAKRLCEYMHRALESLVDALEKAPEKAIGSLEVVPEYEKQQVVYEWNRTEAEYPADKVVHQLFEEQAAKMPDAVAVVSEEAWVSYGELNRRANRLAHYLRGMGVRPEARVAICVERSEEMVVGLLAVLKAGGAYVPLDPAYPPERLSYMVKDSAPVALLTERQLKGAWGEAGEELRVVYLEDAGDWAEQPEQNPDRESMGLTANHLAYVIYTSGSTGVPKGVMVEHVAVCNLITWMQGSRRIGAEDALLQKTPSSFDASVTEFFWPLLTGAKLVMARPSGHKDPAYLWEVLRRNEITTVQFVPSLLEAMLAENSGGECPALTWVQCGGEALPDTLLERFQKQLPQAILQNLYGPTEAAVDVISWMSGGRVEKGKVPVGRPIANTRVYILDAGEAVPVGVAGELYIGGVQVARGYLNRAELTAERFLPDPFSSQGRGRMYRTGDLAKWLPDGNIEFVGRNDFQVKVRGFRIELGEIEARLSEYDGLREAVVVVREDGAGDKRLVAYYTGREEETEAIGAEQLRGHLSRKLPEYMVPAAYVRLDRMPLTPNGKLDRKALPEPDADAYVVRRYEEPIGEIERAIAGIWAEVLQLDKVGRNDNFFELGGQSLLAVKVITRLQHMLGVQVSLVDVFEWPVLVDFAGAAKNVAGTTIPQITRADRRERIPLSFAQQRLWFLAQMKGVSETYHIPFGVRLKGQLDVAALREALDRIVDRHEALRTTFEWKDGEPVQRIHEVEERRFDLVVEDLREEGASDLERRIEKEAGASVDLEAGPLIRGRLMRVGEEEHVLLVTMHHIVSDGWSVGVMLRELSALYSAAVRGEELVLPELGVQYADYAIWQRKWMEGDMLRKQAEYWKRMLEGVKELLELPADHVRPAEQDFSGDWVPVVLDKELTAGLKELSRKHGTTLHMTLLAGWAALLGRLSGRNEVVIGTPVANRSRLEIESLIGVFVNTLALRVDVSGEPEVGELLERVRRQALEAQENQDMPFEQVVELARPVRSLAHSPLFQVMFGWQNATEWRLELAGLQVQPLDGRRMTSMFDVNLSLQEAGERIVGGAEYATALFERKTIERYVGYFRRLLEGMVRDDGAVVDRLEMMGEEERRKIVYEWNRPEAEYEAGKCVHELFEEQVERRPDATAVVSEEGWVSYGELNRRANRLAHYLRERGVGPEERVAICVERSEEMVVGMLAVLKAGGAYVPLDPAYPPERLSYMVKDSRPVVLLTQEHLAGVFEEGKKELWVINVEEAREWEDQPESNLERASVGVKPEHLVYVMYTSGSTGIPKGVMVEHANVARLFSGTDAWFRFDSNDVWTGFHSFAFDFSVWEIWGALLYGGRLIVVSREKARSPEDFYAMVCQGQVTILNQTPGAFRQLMRAQARNGQSHELRQIIFGGEALDLTGLRPWYEQNRSQRARLSNMYGITETTVHVTYRPLDQADLDGSISSPIGRRIPDLRIYILDGEGEPVPEGVAGELYISGVGVARGYLNRAELTAERFVADPYVENGEGRMYRTGDLGRWLPDGTIEFVGRNDFQVKVRGFRIELGEIEARLTEHEGVREAVVVARENGVGDKRLVAYYTGREEEEEAVGAEQLRAHLSGKLPEYMVPAAYVRLERMPLTPNGKLDRRRLPDPEADAYVVRRYEEPIGRIERGIAGIWAEVLKLEKVGRHDNFFELGGHSLLAVTVIERMRQLGLTVDVRRMFASPTVAGLAETLSVAERTVEVPAKAIPENCKVITPEMLPLVELREEEIQRVVSRVEGGAANVQDIYPLAPLQEGMLFHHLMGREGDPYLLAFEASFDSRRMLDAHLEALQAVIDRHDILRTAVQWEGLREPVQVVWRKAVLPVEEVEMDGEAGDIARQLYERFNPRRYRMDLRQAPLVRVYITEDKENERWVMLQLRHHVTGDHSTLELMQEEIEAHLVGEEDRLPEPMPFRNLVAQARLGVSREEHEEYFWKVLGDVEEPTAPFGMLEVRGDGTGIEERRMRVEGELGRRLREEARKRGVSAASVCHVAWGQVLARIAGRDDVVFGTVLLGRMQGGEGADRVMGLFINTLPVRIEIGSDGAETSVRRMHAQLSELLRHEHASLALAQRCSSVAAPTPLFSALLNYRHGRMRGLTDEKVRTREGMRGLYGEERTNYPLTLSVDDVGEGFLLTVQVDEAIGAKRVCEYMHRALESLVDALEETPEKAIGRLEVVPEYEKQQVVYQWNRTEAEYPADKIVHQLFEEQAAKMPDAVAVVSEEVWVSYGELNRRANRLAHYLREMGVRPEARVAICVERSEEMVVGLLAVLKAGGTYVPLDPAYPPERLSYMVKDSEPVALLTERHLKGAWGEAGEELRVVYLEEAGDWARQSEQNPDRESMGLTANHLAYVIYTSGSTGVPKGVMVEHKSVYNTLESTRRELKMGHEDRTAWVSGQAFDISVWELLMVLIAGGTVEVWKREQVLEVNKVRERLKEMTVLHAVPTLMREIVAGMEETEGSTGIRVALTGGDRVSGELIEGMRGVFPKASVRILYGPTETAMLAAEWESEEEEEKGKTPPIGKPRANTRIYILDEEGQPAPVGVSGELYIGGAGVGRGYLKQGELTAERFVADPFVAEGRMYRTGDLGRWLEDGNIEFVGRNDFQVKVRGFRIELGEIEARLIEHDGVKEAVVMARENGAGDKRLVAYYAGREEEAEAVGAEQLRAYLSEKLPEYMVPAAYVRLERMPLTPNGKLDRKALPEPEADDYVVQGYEEPIGRIERTIAGIWAEVLMLEKVGRRDDFFELGGHSLFAMQVIMRLQHMLGVELAIQDVFEQPVLADFAEVVENATRTTLPQITRADKSERIPLSFAQQRLWFLAQMKGVSETYHIRFGVRLKGELDVAALREALDRIVERHEALRTTFEWKDGKPVQRIHGLEETRFDLAEEDLRGESRSELERRVEEEAGASFDLEAGPLIRGRLLRVGEEEHVLLITMHHIVSDGWSMGVMLRELSALYNARVRGEEARLPELGVQYADYAIWQRKWMEGEILSKQAEYWQRTLEGVPELLELPTDHVRPAEQDFNGDWVPVVLEEKLTAGLRELSRKHRTTLHMTLLAGWAALLGRLSGQKEVVIGTPVANRSRLEIENLMGFFVNTLALRVDVSGELEVGALLERVRRLALEAQENQDIPFEQVVELARPVRSLAHSPLFQVMFGWQNATEGRLELTELQIQPVGGRGRVTSKFDVSLSLQEAGERIVGVMEYATTLFERKTMERYVGYFHRLLEGMVRDDRAVVERVELMGEEERLQVVYEWNRTEVEYEAGKCVHELFEEQVERTPDAVAVVSEEAWVSYGELNRRANRLAHYLKELGVKPDDRVAICAERSLELVVALLGVLKAGAAYVPLDPGYPHDRLRYMLKDSASVAFLIGGHESVFERITIDMPVIQVAEVVQRRDLDSERVQTTVGLSPKHLAYVMYTSGSTGSPKGVMVSHEGIKRLVLRNRYATFGNDSVAFASSPAFDAATMEVWAPLLNGGRMVVVDQSELLDATRFGEKLQKQAVNVLWLTVGLFNQYADVLAKEFSQLRYLIVGGDALDPRVIARVLRKGRPEHLLNGYGPTEATTFATTHELTLASEETVSIPIGRPISSTRVYVLDSWGEPVPIGVGGELHIGGVGVARGYLDRAEVTAERFVADPYVENGEGRMYRTGDLGRWLPDGTIEFVGRNDFQVKVRGFRIELGEIEARLTEHEGVREAVVVARENGVGDKRLVAYYTVREEDAAAVGAEQLRAHLSEKLPEYMVPAACVRLERMPLTPNGKLDRRALPDPQADAYVVRGYEEPIGRIERGIAGIWAEVLKLEKVGRHDNFFELGGHSLLAVTVIERMRQLGLTVDVRRMFASPTVAGLAETLSVAERTVEVPAKAIPENCKVITPEMLPLVELREEEIQRVVSRVEGGAANVQDIYPLAPLQEGMLFHHLMGREGDPYLLAFEASFDSRRMLDAHLEALQAVIDRHDILRTAVQWEGLREPVQVVWRKAVLPVEEVEMDGEAGDIARQLYERFNPRRYRMDLRQAPLVRVYITEDKENERWVMLQLRHHVTGDHSTLELMQEEIEAHLVGEEDRLPEPMPFRNLVAQARLGVSREEHEEYFRKVLGDVEEPTAPFGMLEVRGDGTGIEERRMRVEGELGRRLREEARKRGVSAASVCHVAWGQVLARIAGRDDVVFGTVLLGRMQGGEGADRVMGLFINTLPVRIEIGSDGAETSVRRMHAQLSELLRHEHASLALAQRCSAVAAPTPLFSALLNYRHSRGMGVDRSEEKTRAWQGVRLIRGEERTNYPVTLSVDDFGEGFGLTAQAAVPIEAKRVCEYMHRALESLVDALERTPEKETRRLEVMQEYEKQRVVYEWNRTEAEYEAGKCVHELFEEQVERTPDAVAVGSEEGWLSYGELNRRANRLAHYLRGMGVRPDARVAICVERSEEMVVGLLAVLKAGGAYVPLDPAYPVERLMYMLNDSKPVAIVTEERFEAIFLDQSIACVRMSRTEPGRWQDQAEADLDCAGIGLTPQHLAYVIYTSGSTGAPKGVMVPHGGLCNYLMWAVEAYRPEKAVVASSLSFDATVTSLYCPLLRGGSVHLVGEGNDVDGLYWEIQKRDGCGLVKLTPGHLEAVAQRVLSGREQSSVGIFVVGGEMLSGATVELWRQIQPEVRLVNEYGPTETVVGCIAYEIPAMFCGASVAIGKPVANSRIYILDATGNLAPIGVVGELYIAGPGVGRGYLNRAELTAARFVADPFVADGCGRMYGTGDLAKWLEDGNIEFVGRNDFQVKVRGFRIELGEIEARLTEHEGVREAVVVARENGVGDKRLVAYYTGREEDAAAVGAEQLRAHLSEKLPEYMVPAAYVRLERMPLTPNGKLDRTALPEPESGASVLRGYEEPVGDTEKAVAKIWAEVLHLEKVGRNDDFFNLGGHSLLAVQVLIRVQEILKIELNIIDIFDYPVVHSLAEQIVLLHLSEFDSKDLQAAYELMRNSDGPSTT